MGKRLKQLLAAALAVCLSISGAQAVTTNQNGEAVIRVGLASSNAHVPTGELEGANLENSLGAGYRFGYYDSNLNFVELARTDSNMTKVTIVKTQNLYFGKTTYSSTAGGSILVGCYHIRLDRTFASYEAAKAEADRYADGFVAWIDGQYQVRIGAYGTGDAARAAQNTLGVEGTITGTTVYGMSVVHTGTNKVLFQYDCGASGKLGVLPDVTGAEEVQTWFSGYKYRGGFQYFRRTGGNLTVVNVLELEDYINGVVCYEMGREWPLEALKAQAVCARTYVLKNLGKHESYGFDICPSDSCQVYHGMGSGRADYGPSEVSLRAVAETAGMVVKYNGKVAEVFYVSSFGGASEDAKYIWGSDTVNEYPYLCGVIDPYEADLDSSNPQSPWTVTYTTAQLTQQLQKSGLGVGTSVSRLDLTYSSLGNVIQVVVRWANGQSSTISASYIRSRLGVKSIRFTVNGAGTGTTQTPQTPQPPQTPQTPAPGDSSTEPYIISGTGTVSQAAGDVYIISGTGTVSKFESSETSGSDTTPSASARSTTTAQPGAGTVTVSGSTYTFNGGGYGHQVGMSQFGANAMARRGFSYDEIVTFYFPGVQVTHY